MLFLLNGGKTRNDRDRITKVKVKVTSLFRHKRCMTYLALATFTQLHKPYFFGGIPCRLADCIKGKI